MNELNKFEYHPWRGIATTKSPLAKGVKGVVKNLHKKFVL